MGYGGAIFTERGPQRSVAFLSKYCLDTTTEKCGEKGYFILLQEGALLQTTVQLFLESPVVYSQLVEFIFFLLWTPA